MKIALDTLKLAKKVLGRDVADVFDSLRKGQKIQVAFKSVMGMSELTSGSYNDWVVGRRTFSKKYNVEKVQLMPASRAGEKFDKRRDFQLWKRDRDGKVSVSASQGDMGITLVGIKS
jgi:hypothetical protein